ncbi:hypothetical protein LEN26_005362 [Aphanomyces euteiches]|nr:hypothetical protein AeMF1_016640 [Aphanomyces euteiches]KAH9131087.1 hypothetical protein AeNC1_019766 [Aphanomyces euteiches]KAH9138288.1 hypothetical protein LEN26_005362 [Aphanomyces euteiches]
MLSNVTIAMLPPNTTPFLQPQDAGVIRMFKAKVEQLKAKCLVERFDSFIGHLTQEDIENAHSRASKLHEMNVKEAMEIAIEAWSAVQPRSIANCLRHTGILDEDLYELVDDNGVGCQALESVDF